MRVEARSHERRSATLRQLALLGIVAVYGLAGCGTAGTREIRYAGRLAGCGPATPATLTRIGDGFAFAPSDGALILRGRVAADGAFEGALNTQPPGKPAFALTVRGQVGPDGVALSYATPRCAASATLARVRPDLL